MSQSLSGSLNARKLPYRMVDGDASLQDASSAWEGVELVALDLEFVRVNTYYPRPALYQVATRSEMFLIDATVIDDFTPLIELLADQRIAKIVHGGGEDLEVIRTHLEIAPSNMFDTQLAACVVGYGWSIGYAPLVQACFGIELSKEERRSDWLARPLSPSQIQYCLQDVAYLIELHGLLSNEIERLERLSWFHEEMRDLLNREAVHPQDYYLKMSGVRQMTPRHQAVLKSLCEWREHQARHRNEPRQWVVRDEHLLKLARREDLDRAALAKTLPAQVLRRFGDGLLGAFREGRASEVPQGSARQVASHSRELVRSILDAVSKLAEELKIAPELLGRRREIERCVRAWQDGDDKPDYLCGWRGRYLYPVFDQVLKAQESG